jgi:hypothetical protein
MGPDGERIGLPVPAFVLALAANHWALAQAFGSSGLP